MYAARLMRARRAVPLPLHLRECRASVQKSSWKRLEAISGCFYHRAVEYPVSKIRKNDRNRLRKKYVLAPMLKGRKKKPCARADRGADRGGLGVGCLVLQRRRTRRFWFSGTPFRTRPSRRCCQYRMADSSARHQTDLQPDL